MTGKSRARRRDCRIRAAAMEPGRDDREEGERERLIGEAVLAAMEPGRDDREEGSPKRYRLTCAFASVRERSPVVGLTARWLALVEAGERASDLRASAQACSLH